MTDTDTIRATLEAALALNHDDASCRDIAFHMTDWLPELRALVRIYEDPRRCTDDEIAKTVMAFLVHAPAHIAAASKLYTGLPVTDVFGICAVDSGPEQA